MIILSSKIGILAIYYGVGVISTFITNKAVKKAKTKSNDKKVEKSKIKQITENIGELLISFVPIYNFIKPIMNIGKLAVISIAKKYTKSKNKNTIQAKPQLINKTIDTEKILREQKEKHMAKEPRQNEFETNTSVSQYIESIIAKEKTKADSLKRSRR